MTADEAKAAFLAGTPVQHNGINYGGISALIYRREKNDKTKVALTVELYDRGGNSVTIAAPERVTATGQSGVTMP